MEQVQDEIWKLSTLDAWEMVNKNTEVVFDEIPEPETLSEMKRHPLYSNIFNADNNTTSFTEQIETSETSKTQDSEGNKVDKNLKENKSIRRKRSIDNDYELNNVKRNDITSGKNREFENEHHPASDTSSWRELPSIPTLEELTSKSVELPSNNIYGGYKSFEDYLSIHYRLLREDAVSPLRESVLRYKVNPNYITGSSLAVYDHVRIDGYTISSSVIAAKLSFSVRAKKKIKWATSRRLISGSLVLLSNDDFQTFRIGTVCARPLSGLNKHPHEIDVKFEDISISLDPREEYVMIEATSGYWEAYKHVLRSLQRLSASTFPMKDYLVHCKSNQETAKHIQNNPRIRINSILKNNSQKIVNALEPFGPGEYILDSSQLKAYQSMLTKRLSIIQGPPGTGKSFVTLKAIETLLENTHSHVLPILVACQTNHAVDQILIRLLHQGASVMRLGSRTKDPEIAAVTIFQKAKHTKHSFKAAYNEIRHKKQRLIKQITNIMHNFNLEFVTLSYLHSKGIITTSQLESLRNNTEWISSVAENGEKTEEELISIWLGDAKVELITPSEITDGFEEELQIDPEKLEEIQKEAEDSGALMEEELRGKFINLRCKYLFSKLTTLHEKEIDTLLTIPNIWDIPEYSRGIIYCRWLESAYAAAEKELNRLYRFYLKVDRERIGFSNKRAAILLRGANVIGMTTTGLNKYRDILERINPKICFIEEAADVLEGPIIPAVFPSLEQLVLIGDHKQLRPGCSTYALRQDPFNLSISMFERLVENDMEYTRLTMQRRMHPQIRKLVSSVYEDLSDYEITKYWPSIPGMGGIRRFFLTHSRIEDNDGFASKINLFEAQMLVQFAVYLINNGVEPQKITCLTFYAAQKDLIERLLSESLNREKHFIKVATVDGYQGEENDVVLLSLVRNNDRTEVGFLSSPHRVCVSLSRARRGLFIFGNAQLVAESNPLWWDAINTLMNDETIQGLGDHLPLFTKDGTIYINDPVELLDVNMRLTRK
ncbi:Helicase Required for RNAi-mediated heterochromatin assembly Hrr1 [Schizosaccharomyces pombe]